VNVPEPEVEQGLLARMVLRIVIVEASELMMPPPLEALLPEKVLLVIVAVPS
jgi:hypothetical protein